MLGDLEAAVVILEQVLADARRRGDQLDACAATMALLGCLIESGDLSRAIAEGKTEPSAMEAAGLAGTDEHLRLGATLLWAQAERGDLLSASVRAGCLIQQAESLGTTRGRGSVYWTAAMVAEECGDLTLAKRYTERAVALLGEHDGPRDLPRLRLHYAHVLLAQSPPEPAEAEAQIDRAEPLIQASGSEMEKSTADIHRSRAHLMLGDPDRALDLATTALARLTDGPRLDESEANIVLGEALDALGQRDLALDAYRMAAEQLTGMGAVRRAVAAWRRLADRLRSAGEMGLALEAYSRGLDAAGVRAHLAPPAAGRLLDPQDRI